MPSTAPTTTSPLTTYTLNLEVQVMADTPAGAQRQIAKILGDKMVAFTIGAPETPEGER